MPTPQVCIVDRKVTVAANPRHALSCFAQRLHGLGWTIVETFQEGLTGQLFDRGSHSIVITCMPGSDDCTEFLITVSSMNSPCAEELIAAALAVLTE